MSSTSSPSPATSPSVLIQLSEVDIAQKIVESLSNVCTRAVLFAIRKESKDAMRLASELHLSPSTIYKTLSVLEYLALAEIDRYEITSEGKKTRMYRSRISKVEITMNGTDITLNLYPNIENTKSNR